MTAANPEALDQLLLVQEHDGAIDALRHRRDTLPEIAELASIDARKQELEGQLAEIGARRHVLERDQRRLEDEVALVEARIVAEDGKLYGGEVTGVKDLQALQDEIRGLKARQLAREDDILAVMEAAEPVDAELQSREAEVAELDARAQVATEGLAEAQAVVDAEHTEVEAQRAEAVSGVPDELMDVYRTLRSQPGRVAVAKLVQGRCHGCHLELAAVEIDRLKKLPADELVHCDECGCILVR